MKNGSKRGANGGDARAAKLSKEQRSKIAKDAASARWAKKKGTGADVQVVGDVTPVNLYSDKEYTSKSVIVDEIPAAPPAPVEQAIPPSIPNAPKPEKRSTKRKARLPKEFGAAHSYAEKRLADAIKERAEAMGRVAALNAEIPSLVQIIKALKSTEPPVPSFPNPQAYQTVPMPIASGIDPSLQAGNIITQANIPPTPLAHGGAVDFEGAQQELPEDAFLSGSVGGDKGWV